MNVLTPTINRVGLFKQLHIRCFQSPAPALAVPCSPMPVVTSVSQVAAYQICSHKASECLVAHELHGICYDLWEPTKSGGFLDQAGMASRVLKTRCAYPAWRQACPQLGALTGPDPWLSTRHGGITIPLSVLRMSVCVSLLSPAWPPWTAFADVGPNILVRYWYHSYGAQFLCWCLTFGETGKALPTKGEAWQSVLRGYKTPIVLEAKS